MNKAGWGLAVLRIVTGLVFLMHGGQKVFVYGLGGVAGAFAKIGIPAPEVSALLATSAEFLGGIALLLGLLTRWATIPVGFTMLVAVLTVHVKNGFFAPAGFEYPLTLLAANVALGLAGPGRLAVDNWLARRGSAEGILSRVSVNAPGEHNR
jgi:putative oxidoreductase